MRGVRGRRSGLAVYVVAACLLRGADAAAIIGVVLLAQERGLGAGTGLLAACLTLPHLLGPVAAQLLDRTRAKRAVLAGAGAVYGLALASAALAVGSLPSAGAWVAAAALLVAGAAGPLLTGGLSSQLAGIVGGDGRTQRRAQSVDAFTYGIAGTVGPAAIGAVAATASPTAAVLSAAGAALAGAVIVPALPRPDRDGRGRPAPAVNILQAVAMLVRVPGLRRTTVATALTAVPLGAVPLIAVATATSLSVPATQSATLTAAYGFGNLAASLALIAVPLRGEADRLVLQGTLGVLGMLAAGLLAVTFPLAIAVYAALGVVTGVLFTASLAARTAYAPHGAEAQVFVTMAGIKVGFSSLGAALVGALLPLGSAALFAGATLLVLATTAAVLLDRRLAPSPSP